MSPSFFTPNCSFALKPLAAAVLLICATSAQAAPSFNNSPGNTVTVVTNGSTTTVTQASNASNRAVANWNDFSIPLGESVVFIQPNSSSVVLNRVVGSNPSEIFGRMTANGRVFLINPNGIVFGAGSEVSVGSMVASTLTLKPGFQGNSELLEFEVTNSSGTITSSGTINAKDIAFISPGIQNSGTLTATGAASTVHMISASEVTANTAGTDLAFSVQQGHENAVISQLGNVFAQGGKIVLIARPVSGGSASVINTAGVARASQIVVQGDTVKLTGSINLPDNNSNLAVTAHTISQDDALLVGGAAELTAQNVILGRADNDFKGQVNLNVTGQADVRDANQLTVGGSVNNATLQANTLSLNRMTAEGDLGLFAENIGQADVLTVKGQSRLEGGSVNLAYSGNDFDGAVNLNLTGSASIHASEDLQLVGTAQSVSARAGENLLVSGLDSQNMVLAADQVQLQNLTVRGDLSLNGGTVSQQGALTVEGQTRLAALQVNLQHAGNDFKGDVVLSAAGDVSLRDSNNLRLQGQAGKVSMQAEGSVSQSAALTIEGTSSIVAAAVDLSRADNSFGNAVSLNVEQGVNVRAAGNLTVGGKAVDMTARAGGKLQFQATEVASLVATGEQVSQSGALVVAGNATVTGKNIVLANSQNDFLGVLDLAASGQANVSDRNDLVIAGQVHHLDVNVANTLTLGELQAGTGNFTAATIELNRLNIQNSARLQASQITQTQATQSAGVLTFVADTVTLNNTANDFRGEVKLEGVDTATIHDANQLRVGGQANALNVTATDGLTFTGNTLGSLNAKAAQINQTGALNVLGESVLQANSVNLQHLGNDFVGLVNLLVSGPVQLHDTNNLTVQGRVGNAWLSADNNLTLNALQADRLHVVANRLEQAAALTVAGELVLDTDSANLNRADNRLSGNVVLLGGNNTLHTQGDLKVEGEAAQLDVVADTIGQTDSLTVRGMTSLSADSVDLQDAGNDFQGRVDLAVTGQAKIHDQNNLSISGNVQRLDAVAQGTLNVQGAKIESIKLNAQTVELGQLASLQDLNVTANQVRQNAALLVNGVTTLTANEIELDNPANDFVGQVQVRTGSVPTARVSLADKNSLNVQGDNLELAAQVQGDFNLQAENVVLNNTQVQGNTVIELTGALTQKESVRLGDVNLTANKITLTNSGNQFDGNTRVDSDQLIELGAVGNLNLDTGSSVGELALNVKGDVRVSGGQVVFSGSRVDGKLRVVANQVSQTAAIHVQGDAEFEAPGGAVQLQHAGNEFGQTVSAHADNTSISARGDLRVLNLTTRGGEIAAAGQLTLLGRIEQNGGSLNFAAEGTPHPLSPADIALLLPPGLDIYSGKAAVNPITGLGRITLASAGVHQQSGQIVTSADSMTRFAATGNASIVLAQGNQIKGGFAALSGQDYGQSFSYQPLQGASLFAVNNDVQLRVAAKGVEADLVAIRSRGLATVGPDSLVRARMPYNDIAAGAARSYAGLVLSIPLSNSQAGASNVAPFGESSGAGPQAAAAGAIRVEVGDLDRAGLGGFVTVLPFEGSKQLPGQVVYLAGPERRGTYSFFYDGARNLNRIPVVYNGSLLLSPQENAALTTAQGAVVLARQEQTRSVVRTENVAGKIINGVVAEVGPGRPATEGDGEAAKPASCDAVGEGLSCSH